METTSSSYLISVPHDVGVLLVYWWAVMATAVFPFH